VAGERVHDLTLGRSLGFLEQALELLACIEPAGGAVGDPLALLARLEPHFDRLSSVIVVDGGGRSEPIVTRGRTRGLGCAWYRVGKGASSGARGETFVDPSAIERGEELAL
jgi:hypothetical protein